MATADEILAVEVEECDDILIVDLDSRKIIIPPNVTNIGVEFDDKVRKLHFQIPRYYCDIDLFEFEAYINYINANGEPDRHYVRGRKANDERIWFDWVVGRNAVSARGDVSFIVCLKKYDSGTVLQEFNTTIATLPVLPGLETDMAIVQKYADVLEQWRIELSKNVVTPETIKEVVEEYLKNNPIEGAAFEIDETLSLKDGVLSVNTADAVEADNSLPVTSAAVQTVVGNIEVLLKTI